jgi:hypothetical protein
MPMGAPTLESAFARAQLREKSDPGRSDIPHRIAHFFLNPIPTIFQSILIEVEGRVRAKSAAEVARLLAICVSAK